MEGGEVKPAQDKSVQRWQQLKGIQKEEMIHEPKKRKEKKKVGNLFQRDLLFRMNALFR